MSLVRGYRINSSDKPTNTIIPLSIFLLTLALSLVLYLIIWDRNSAAIALVACIVFLLYGLILFKLEPLFFLLIFLFYYGQASAILSGVYIESGAYIPEQGQYAYATGSTARLVFYDIVFITVALLFFKWLVRIEYIRSLIDRRKPPGLLWRNAVYAACFVTLTVLGLGFALYGSALLMGIDRFAYWSNHPAPILQTFAGQLYVLSLLLGILFAQSASKIKKTLPLSVFVAIVACQILQGEKFGSLFVNCYLFALPTLIVIAAKTRTRFSLTKIAFVALPIVFVLIGLVAYHYAYIHTGVGVAERFDQRFASQGYVWWGTDKLYPTQGAVTDSYAQLTRELNAWFSTDPESEQIGLKFLMTSISPPLIVNRYLEHGVNFTMGYPAIGLYLFGHWGLVFAQAVAAFIAVLSVRYLLHSVLKSRVIQSAIAVKIFYAAFVAFSMGNLHMLFSIDVAAYILIALLMSTVNFRWRSAPVTRLRPANSR